MTHANAAGVRHATEQAVADSVRRILRALRLSAISTQSSMGISAAQLFVLRHLADHGIASITDLARETLTDRSSVAAVVDRLVERGLAQRSQSQEDRRRAAIKITDQGARLVIGAPPAPGDLVVTALRRLNDAELTVLGDSLRALVAAMGLEATPAAMLFEDDEAQSAARTDRGSDSTGRSGRANV